MQLGQPKFWATALLSLVALATTGCGDFLRAKKDADLVLTRHFQNLATNGIEAALSDYSPSFFQKTPQPVWGTALTNLSSKLGTYRSHNGVSWKVFKKRGTGGSGTTVTIQCQVQYSKHSATEKFSLFKGPTDGDFKIVEHTINSTALLTQ